MNFFLCYQTLDLPVSSIKKTIFQYVRAELTIRKFPAYLVAFAGEVFNRKLHFLCNELYV